MKFVALCVLLALLVTVRAEGGAEGRAEGDPSSSPPLLCKPHECLGIDLEPEIQHRLLDELRRELDALPRSGGRGSGGEGGGGEGGGGTDDDTVEVTKGTEAVAAAPPYRGFRNDSTALLITVGGPPRAESIVQAHVLIKLVREHHGENASHLPIEVWHAGEPGVQQACEVWGRLFEVTQKPWFHFVFSSHERYSSGCP